MRIALAQVNPTVGDIAGNAAIVRDYAQRAHAAGADLVAFPEMMLTGYPVEDLVFRETFVAASQAALQQLAQQLAGDGFADLPVVVGFLDADGPTTPGPLAERGRGPRNAAAVLQHGKAVLTYYKQHLPNYGVFDENRYFVPGHELPTLQVAGSRVAIVICDDIWHDGGPIAQAAAAGVDLVVCINGSPYELHKDAIRLQLCQAQARAAGATLAYLNMVGGQDDLVFDGDSMVVDYAGQLLARAGQFDEELLIVDTARSDPGLLATPLSDEAEVWEALVTGLRDYVDKNRFPSVVLGISGGIDSAVCAALVVDALGGDRVHGVALPSAYSSSHSLVDAKELAERTGLHYREIPIKSLVDGFVGQLGLTGVAEENLQARVRGVTLMGLSNAEGHLVLATGNKSEFAVGYSTLYGDAVGGFAPIKDVYKTHVWQLARWRNQLAIERGETPPIPENTITKPPSAELRHDQLDTDSLPPYELLDAMLARYIDADAGRAELLADGFDAALIDRVVALVDGAEYKRRQNPPGTKISLKAFGRDRRLPMTNRWREH